LDGRFRKVLVRQLQDPRAIALDPFRFVCGILCQTSGCGLK